VLACKYRRLAPHADRSIHRRDGSVTRRGEVENFRENVPRHGNSRCRDRLERLGCRERYVRIDAELEGLLLTGESVAHLPILGARPVELEGHGAPPERRLPTPSGLQRAFLTCLSESGLRVFPGGGRRSYARYQQKYHPISPAVYTPGRIAEERNTL
jgi:hypothetical protein